MRIALGIEYDGSAYFGWQRQLLEQTVQGRVERGLSVVADHTVSVVCAGRTDTGVRLADADARTCIDRNSPWPTVVARPRARRNGVDLGSALGSARP